MLTAVVAMGVAIVALFPRSSRRPGRSTTTTSTVVSTLQPVLNALQHDVDGTVHAILLDSDGCGHANGQRAVVSFLADGSAPAAGVVVRRDARRRHAARAPHSS